MTAPQGAQEVPPPPQEAPPTRCSWVGKPTKRDGGRTFYAAATAPDGQTYSLGDDVYLRAADPGLPPFVARLESLHEETAPGGGGGERRMVAGVRWFYRPSEVDLEHELAVEGHELFLSDDHAAHDASALCGKCAVLTPAQADRWPDSSAAEPGPGTFVCTRKYIAAEGRVVSIEDGMQGVTLAAALQEKPFTVVGGQMVQRGPTAADKRQRPKRVRGGPPAAAAAAAAEQEEQGQQQGPQRSAAELSGKPVLNSLMDQPPQPPAKKRRHELERGRSSASSGAAPAAGAGNRDGSAGSDQRRSASTHSGGASGGEGAQQGVAAPPRRSGRTKSPKETQGRWSKERYENAQSALVAVLRGLGGTAADRAVPRPTLREAARREVGDTGLLDHLLKHMADQAVGAEGERLRRRHDAGRHMVYWLQTPAEAQQEQQLLQGEVQALSAELRQVQEARRVLSAVRAPAMQAASTLQAEEPSRPLSAGGNGAPTPTATPALEAGAGAALAPPVAGDELLRRVQTAESQADAVLKRLQDAERLALAGLEAARGEAAESARLLGGQLSAQLAALADVARLTDERCTALEHHVAALAEAGQGRYEAVVGALTANAGLRAEVVASQARISGLEEQVEALRRAVAGTAGSQPAVPAALATGGPSAGQQPLPNTPLHGQAVPVASTPVVPAPAAAGSDCMRVRA